MDYNELLAKYHALQTENNHLKDEVKRLKLQLGIPEQQGIPFDFFEQKPMPEMIKVDCNEVEIPDISCYSFLKEECKIWPLDPIRRKIPQIRNKLNLFIPRIMHDNSGCGKIFIIAGNQNKIMFLGSCSE